ncbi:hypothetical protein O3M35_011997 [Rhynocoris fuscipes]|uniref:Probable ATP-dependent RNA helicase spindle-E n=1 Tax=Rhynocoris fuscipes TaxID=488301 RepID=A0AAW1CUE3_9HEMI
MNYRQLIGLFHSDEKFQKIKVEGGQTEGHLLFDDIPSKGKRTVEPRKELGKSYARKYQEEDEMEDIILRNRQENAANAVSGLDDLTSIGTLANIHEINNEFLSQVYESYSFEHEIDQQLLIHTYKEKIMNEIEQNQVVIIKGQTGCGKTTQVPQYILDSCREDNVHCNIVVTQPRRIAAISVARRVCQERGWDLGTLVGYQVALDRQTSEDTRLLYCTAGVLLQILIGKQQLSNYTHIIIDEIHERDNETDFLLIVIKKFLRIPGNRTKVILMSATINTDKFVDYFSKRVNGLKLEPPVIELESKSKFNVQYFYLDSLVDRIPITMPLLKLSEPRLDHNAYELAALLVEVFHTIDDQENKKQFIGSVLIFLPGLREIEIMYETLQKRKENSKFEETWNICPLHSSVTNEEQIRVFKLAKPGERKIILATNIAESSITVPDVKYVIDFCLMKMQVQERDTSYSSLQLSWASKSQAIQRAGRVGRVMPGRVYRLVSQTLYEKFQEDCSPEILRCPLETLVLKAKELNIGPPKAILGRAMDPPDLSNIQTNILNLKEMGALQLTANGVYDEFDGDLTFIGKVMASLPIDPYLSKLIIIGYMFSCLEDCIIMASAMAVKSIFSTPFKQQLEAYNSKLRWAHYSDSDPIAFLSAYKLWRHKTTSGQFKRSGGFSEEEWASKFFVQVKSLKEVARLEGEILSRLKKLGLHPVVGANKVTWAEHEVPLVLKIALSGAFYPNYFLRNQIDEKEAIKVLGGRDPFTTVYLTNLPPNQPGPLYIESIKQHFHHCGSNICVSFDGSSKVYLTFGSSCRSIDDKKSYSIRTPGTISMAVYRAIKMRHLQIPITISVLPPGEARNRALKIFGDSLSPNVKCWNRTKTDKPINKSMLPGLGTSVISIVITHINSPSHFYCLIDDEALQHRQDWINRQLNQHGVLKPLENHKWKSGTKCAAQFTENGFTAYYRANILNVDLKTGTAQIIYVDYGNEAEILLDELRDYTDDLIQTGVRDEPPLAIECTLAEIQPSARMNPKGHWSKQSVSVFESYFKNRPAIALIYSIVNTVMSVKLYQAEKVRVVRDLPEDLSFNYEFVKKGFAEMAEEPYLSRENHVVRQMALKSPEALKTYTASYLPEDPFSQFQFDPPSEKECTTKVYLKGPKSPLEMSLYGLTKKCSGRDVHVEWNSVNSVLIDNVPMDSHDRMMVAANVTQSTTSERLTLRNTTLLPNMHGLPSLICLIFAPRVELRTDPDREKFTGALCGLGFDPETGEGYHPENDMEVMFDVKYDLEDLEYINKMRFWMNFIVGGGEAGIMDSDISLSRVVKAQNKLKEYLLFLITKNRPSQAPTLFDDSYAWDQLPQEVVLDPLGPRSNINNTIYPLIWGVELNTDNRPSKAESIKTHLKLLQTYADGADIMKNGTKCELCEVYTDDVQSLRLHLETNLHKTNLIQFNLSLNK